MVVQVELSRLKGKNVMNSYSTQGHRLQVVYVHYYETS